MTEEERLAELLETDPKKRLKIKLEQLKKMLKRFAFLQGVGIVGHIYTGWIIQVFWKWFVVPATGLSPISLPVAIGLDLLISFIVVDHLFLIHMYAKLQENVWEVRGKLLLAQTVMLGAGFIISRFV